MRFLLDFCAPRSGGKNHTERSQIGFAKESCEKKGHPVIGAIVGGLVAKTPGAIVGAVVGNNADENGLSTVEISKLLGCTVVVRLPDQKTIPLRFGVHDIGEQHRRLVHASLLQKGDTITVVCRVNKKSGEVILYEWRGK